MSLPQSDHQDFNSHKTSSSSGGDSIPRDTNASPSQDKNNSNGSGAYIPNLCDMFPPPPDYPPSDIDTPRSARNNSNNKVSCLKSQV